MMFTSWLSIGLFSSCWDGHVGCMKLFCSLSFWLCTGDSANDWLIIALFSCWYLPVVRWQHKYALCKWSANYLDLYYLLAVMKKSYWLAIAIRLNCPPNCTCKPVYKETSWKKGWLRIYTLRKIILPTQIQWQQVLHELVTDTFPLDYSTYAGL